MNETPKSDSWLFLNSFVTWKIFIFPNCSCRTVVLHHSFTSYWTFGNREGGENRSFRPSFAPTQSRFAPTLKL